MVLGPLLSFLRAREEQPREREETPQPKTITTVGAWCGASSLRSLKTMCDDVKFARLHRLNRLDLIVNDFSKARREVPFSTYDIGKISTFAKIATDAGIEVHLMSWIMPFEDFIEDAARELMTFSKDLVRSIQFDAEEPWTQAVGGLPYAVAAQLVRDEFHGAQIGVTGIGYTPVDKFGPLANVCDYVVPQCYSTSTSGLRPESVVQKLVKRYRTFTNTKIVVGLAAYRQSGISGHTEESAIRTAFHGVEQTVDVDTVVYWSLAELKRKPKLAKVISTLRAAPIA